MTDAPLMIGSAVLADADAASCLALKKAGCLRNRRGFSRFGEAGRQVRGALPAALRGDPMPPINKGRRGSKWCAKALTASAGEDC